MTDTTIAPVSAETAEAVQQIMGTLTRCWALGDAETMAGLYAEDASVLLPGARMKGRAEIAAWMGAAFAGKWRGTHILGVPLEMRHLSEDVCLLVSEGGAYVPGADEVSPDNAIRGMWMFVRSGSEWQIAAYTNTPAGTPIAFPAR